VMWGFVLNCVSCSDSVVMDWLENIHCDIAVLYCAEWCGVLC
jgi:hypothetical protein